MCGLAPASCRSTPLALRLNSEITPGISFLIYLLANGRINMSGFLRNSFFLYFQCTDLLIWCNHKYSSVPLVQGGNDKSSAFQLLSEEIPNFRNISVLESKFNFCTLMLALFYSLYIDFTMAVNKAANFTKSFVFILKILDCQK